MYTYKYPRPAVATDVILVANYPDNPEVMLIERLDDPCKGMWAFPGGFMEIDETAEEGTIRELEEETGLVDIEVHQFRVASKVDRDPRGRVLSIIFYAFIDSKNSVKPVAQSDAKSVNWFGLNDLPKLAFDHDEVMSKFKQSLSSGKLQ